MKQISKVIEIPTNATKAQMQDSLDTHLVNGWVLVSIFNHNSKTYAVLIKTLRQV